MPNHVLNKVVINGNKRSINKCVKQILNAYKDENGEINEFSFQTIIPMPKSLRIESSSMVDEAINYIMGNYKELPKSWKDLSKKELNKRIELGKTAINNIAFYDYKDWYDWSIHNWGTKWDCYDVYAENSEDCIYITFKTAWSTPYPVFEELAKQYPTLNIEVQYADEDFGSNCGTYSFKNGEFFEDSEGDYEFACQLWEYEPDEVF